MMAFFVYGLPAVTASFFQAIGKPINALAISVSRQILFLIPLAIFLSSHYGLNGALLAAPIADILAFLFAMVLIVYEWKKWNEKGFLS